MQSLGETGRDCARAAGAIEDFGDGRLGRFRWALLRRHVRECEECGSYLRRMSAVLEALADLEEVRAPDEFAQLVMGRLVAGLVEAAREDAGESRPRRNLLWVAAAGVGVAMAVALAVVRWALGRGAHDKVFAARTV